MASLLCAELIGRDDEIDIVEAALSQAGAGEGQLLLLVGDAGVGKSRLAREARRRALTRGMTVMFGRATEGTAPVPFRALAEALLSGFAAPPDLSAEEVAPFASILRRVVPQWNRSGSGAPSIVGSLELGEAIVRVLAASLDTRGGLLVLEDLHWADPETLSVLEYFGDHLRRTRTVCLATVRMGEASAAESLAQTLRDRRSAQALELRGLPPVDIERMVASCLTTDIAPGAVVEMVRALSDGMPLLVEELVAGLVESGELVLDVDGVWAVGEAFTARVPASFGDVVARRLRTLGDDDRLVVSAAAMFGRRFDWTLLPVATGLSQRAVVEGLRRAVDAYLLVEEDDTFAFRHALSRDAVLKQTIAPERQRLASLALTALEQADPTLPGSRCELASDLAEAAGEHRRAAELHLESGRRAVARGALASAAASLDRARSLAGDDAALLGRIDETDAHAAALAGNVDRALALSRAVLAAPGETLDATRRTSLSLVVARAALQAGRWSDAQDAAGEARRLAEQVGDDAATASACAAAAQAAIAQRRPEEAIALARTAVDIGRKARAPAAVCEALEVLGREARLRDLAEAEQRFDEARLLAERHGLKLWQARALHELGTIDLFTNQRIDRLDEARRAAVDAGAVATVALVDLHRAAIALSRFDPDPACDAANRGADLSRRLRLATLPMTLVHLASGHALAGREAAMDAALDEALALAPDDPEVRAGAPGRARVLLHVRRAHWVGARESLDEAVNILRAHPDVWFPFWGLWALLRAAEGLDGEAVCAEAESMPGSEISFNRGRVLRARAIVAGREDDRAAADALLDQADSASPVTDAVRVWLAVERLLLAPVAWHDGWGRPLEWAREGLAVFEERGFPELAGASRSFLRAAGQPVPRRGRGETDVPADLAGLGVTTREADVLRLLAVRLSNKEIGERLHLSPRTVERHVANLLVKTTAADRGELGDLAQLAGLTAG